MDFCSDSSRLTFTDPIPCADTEGGYSPTPDTAAHIPIYTSMND